MFLTVEHILIEADHIIFVFEHFEDDFYEFEAFVEDEGSVVFAAVIFKYLDSQESPDCAVSKVLFGL